MVILGVNFALTFIYRHSRCVQFHRVSFLIGVGHNSRYNDIDDERQLKR